LKVRRYEGSYDYSIQPVTITERPHPKRKLNEKGGGIEILPPYYFSVYNAD
jgi:hypothetical protein